MNLVSANHAILRKRLTLFLASIIPHLIYKVKRFCIIIQKKLFPAHETKKMNSPATLSQTIHQVIRKRILIQQATGLPPVSHCDSTMHAPITPRPLGGP